MLNRPDAETPRRVAFRGVSAGLTRNACGVNISVTDISSTDIVKVETMKKPEPQPESLLPLTPAVFHILLALAGGERHGYAIMQQVARDTNDRLRMGPGTLYGTIKRMISARLVEESDERPDPDLDDERRRYYRLTQFGERVAAAESQRLADLVRVARTRRLVGEAQTRLMSGAC